MSYAQVKPEYYRMFQPDSPWHAGSEGWTQAPWPSWGVNPNRVGPPRLAVEGLGAYFKPVYEKPIAGLGAYFKPTYEKPISGLGGCGCGAARGIGADATVVDNTVMTPQPAATTTASVSPANKTNAALLIGLGVAVIIGGVIFLGPHGR